MARLGYTDDPKPQPTPRLADIFADVGQAGNEGMARQVQPAAPSRQLIDGQPPLLIDGQLIRLGAETFPLTAISGVAVVAWGYDVWAGFSGWSASSLALAVPVAWGSRW